MNYGRGANHRPKYNMYKKYLNIATVKPRVNGKSMQTHEIVSQKVGFSGNFLTLLRKIHGFFMSKGHEVIII
jgi:hypothetical protein